MRTTFHFESSQWLVNRYSWGPLYYVMHHTYPDSYLSSYTTLFDGLMGTACQIAGHDRVALTGASGAFGSGDERVAGLRAGARRWLHSNSALDWTYEDYSGADAAAKGADILVLAHGAKGQQAMQANCDSFLTLIGRSAGGSPELGRFRRRSLGDQVRKSSSIRRFGIRVHVIVRSVEASLRA